MSELYVLIGLVYSDHFRPSIGGFFSLQNLYIYLIHKDKNFPQLTVLCALSMVARRSGHSVFLSGVLNGKSVRFVNTNLSRRCPRNGRSVKSFSDATVRTHGKVKRWSENSPMSPDTSLI